MAEAEGARALFKQVADRVEARLFGVREPLRLVLIGILTDSHVLIDDVPGVGKTTMVRMLAPCSACSSSGSSSPRTSCRATSPARAC